MNEMSERAGAPESTPPIWVISLASAHERRRFVVEGFSALNIPFELVDGVDGVELTDAELAHCSRRRALLEIGRPMTRGELGCAMSHLLLYERMRDESIPVAVIMEDDVAPTPALIAVLAELHRLPADWDVVTLHSLFDTADPVPVDDGVIAGRFRVCRYRGPVYGTQCYAITLAGARRALDAAYPVALPLDELLFRAFPAGLQIYGIEPKVVHEGQFESELVARSSITDADRMTFGDRMTVALGKLRRRLRGRRR